ncbi:MAG TPA: recombinase RecT [Thermomicrobiales bacterium]|jgi:hypothetical protein
MSAQERSIVPMGPQGLAPTHETDWREVERIFRGMIARGTEPAAVDAAIMVCQQLGFNPILNHTFLIKGQVYVSHKGLLNLAHRNPNFDGIELLEESENQTHWTAKVAVYRKDMRPFVYTGRYPKGGDKKQYGPEMAVTRAETMALRRAFDVSMPIYEEINWQEQPSQGAGVSVREVPPAQLAAPVAPAEESRCVATVRQMGEDGVTVKEITDFINSAWDNVTEAEQLASTDALDAIKAERRAAKAARQQRQQVPAPIEATVVETPPVEVGPLGDSLKPATQRQVRFIFAIGKEAGLDDLTVDTRAQEMFGGTVEQLNRRDAVLLIEALQRRRNESYQRPQTEIDADKARELDEVPF